MVWRQAVAADTWLGSRTGHEHAEENNEAASVLLDVRKFYESFSLRELRRRALEQHVSHRLVHLAVALYTGLRLVRLEGRLAIVVFSWKGLPAGCGLAALWVAAYMIPPIDAWLAARTGLHSIRLDVYLDDLVLQALAPRRTVAAIAADAAISLTDVIELGFDAEVAEDKIAIVASSAAVAEEVRKRMGKKFGELPPCERTAAVNLGIDFGAGAARLGMYITHMKYHL